MEILAPLFTTDLGRRAGLGALAASAFLLLTLAMHSFSTWYQDWTMTHHTVASSESSSGISSDVSQLIMKIPAQHLFGQYQMVQSEVLPVTSLQLRLVGVIKTPSDQSSKVIISEADKPGKVYQIGDGLPSGVRVSNITQDGVILDNAGRLEKLPLQRQALSFKGAPTPMPNRDETEEG